MRNCQLRMQVKQHSCSETPTSLLSTWPLPRANSAGPRRRVAGQQDHRRSQPEPLPDGRWRCEGAGTAAGWWLRAVERESRDRGIQSNTADGNHFRKFCLCLGDLRWFCVFRESVLARTFTSLFVLWIGEPTYQLLSLNSFEVHCPFGNLILFLDGVCGFWTYFRCWKKVEANHYANM